MHRREIRQDISTYIHKQVQGKVKELFTELKTENCNGKSTKINFSAYLAHFMGDSYIFGFCVCA